MERGGRNGEGRRNGEGDKWRGEGGMSVVPSLKLTHLVCPFVRWLPWLT